MVSNLQFSETFPQRGMDFRRVPMKFLFHKKRCEAGWAMSLLEGFILIPRPNISVHMEWFIWVPQWRFQGRGPEGPGPHLIFRPYWGPKGRRRFFWHCPRRPLFSGSGWGRGGGGGGGGAPPPPPPPPPIWGSGSATVFSVDLEIGQLVAAWRTAISATSSVHI